MWVIPSSLGWPSAPEWGDSSWGCNSPSPDTAVWLTLSGKPTQRPLSWREWKNRSWSQRLFSRAIWQISMPAPLQEWLTSYLRASRASPTPSLAEGKDTPMSEPCGQNSSESWASVDPPWSSSRTSQSSLPGFESPESDFASWVTRSKARSTSLRKTLAHRISASGCSSWPTPDARASTRANRSLSDGAAVRPLLAKLVETWPTPDTQEGGRAQPFDQGGRPLEGEARNWPSPGAEDSESCGNHPDATDSLTGATRLWPTPMSHERAQTPRQVDHGAQLANEVAKWPSPNAADADKGTDPIGAWGGGDSLKAKSETWPTPRAMDAAGADYQYSRGDHEKPVMGLSGASRSFRPVLKISSCGPECSPKHRRLNPRFVEWLMNWPRGWTGFEPVGTEWSRWRRQSRSWLSRLGFLENNDA